MIDPIQFLAGSDVEQESSSVKESLGTPLASELKKEIPAFTLGGEAKLSSDVIAPNALPNPMAMMQDENASLVDPELQEALDSEELKEQINNLRERLGEFRVSLEEGQTPKNLEQEHFHAVGVVMDLINEDLGAIAESTQQDLQKDKEEDAEHSLTRKVINWISSGEEVLNRALLYFSDRNGERENLANFLKVQYAVQRATQRAELFASIVGTSVSSIKTIMTTQLG